MIENRDLKDQDELTPFEKFQQTVVWEYIQVITVACALVFGLIRPFVVEAYKIPSSSMENTLLIGDRILVSKFIYGFTIPGTKIKLFDFHKPDRGDVVVFVPPHERHKNFIKRAIAIAGDTVETRGDRLFVNGEEIDGHNYTKYVYGGGGRFFPPFVGMSDDVPRHKNWKDFSDLDEEKFDELFDNYTISPRSFRSEFPEGKPFVVPESYIFMMGDNRDQSYDSRGWGPVSLADVKGQAFAIYWSMDGWSPRFERIGKLIKSEYNDPKSEKK